MLKFDINHSKAKQINGKPQQINNLLKNCFLHKFSLKLGFVHDYWFFKNTWI